jgi:hypothetical protein
LFRRNRGASLGKKRLAGCYYFWKNSFPFIILLIFNMLQIYFTYKIVTLNLFLIQRFCLMAGSKFIVWKKLFNFFQWRSSPIFSVDYLGCLSLWVHACPPIYRGVWVGISGMRAEFWSYGNSTEKDEACYLYSHFL